MTLRISLRINHIVSNTTRVKQNLHSFTFLFTIHLQRAASACVRLDNPLELKIDFPVNSYEVPHLPGKYFKVLVPADTMTLDKLPLFNYGLTDIESFLDKGIHKPSSLKRTINPKESSGFYVVMLCLVEGAHGTMRTGLTLKGQDLFYRIKIDGSKSNSKSNDKEIHSGRLI